jgi:hypothetical protein
VVDDLRVRASAIQIHDCANVKRDVHQVRLEIRPELRTWVLSQQNRQLGRSGRNRQVTHHP